MQVPILEGIYTDGAPDFRTRLPRNMVPVPKATGIAEGYLRPGDGLVQFGTGPGADRGGIAWDGVMYRVMGTKLVRVLSDGTVTPLGDVGAGGPVTMDYSFGRLAIAASGSLYYWDGASLSRVTDSDIGTVLDVLWVDGYFMTTDGASLVVTELGDPSSVSPLKYGSSEADPDRVVSLVKVRNEVYVLNRHTIEVFDNVGGTGFPFARIAGAQVPRGCVGVQACQVFGGAVAFVGSGRNEAPAVWLAANGNAAKLSTGEVDRILAGYSEAELASAVMESRIDSGHQHLLIHLPDRCLVYDGAATQILGMPVWFGLDSGSGAFAQYRARGLVWCYGKWLAGDPTGTGIAELTREVSSHYGSVVAWELSTQVLYAQSRNAIVHELELVALTGRVAAGADPVVWASYSSDGQTWSQERPAHVGQQGERDKRIAWRRQGMLRHWRIQRIRGTSEAHIAPVRLEAQVEALNG